MNNEDLKKEVLIENDTPILEKSFKRKRQPRRKLNSSSKSPHYLSNFATPENE